MMDHRLYPEFFSEFLKLEKYDYYFSSKGSTGPWEPEMTTLDSSVVLKDIYALSRSEFSIKLLLAH
jgi:hypothetical protein